MQKKTLYALIAMVLAICVCALTAEARVTQIVITTVQSPTFGGTSFGTVGQYEKLVGKAYGELDPTDHRNSIIVDLENAPRNSKGMVEYSMDIYILRPIHPENGNGRVFYEVNNRGNKLALGWMNFFGNETHSSNDPTTAADAGDGFLMREGYTIVWSGWDPIDPVATTPTNGLTITVPVAKNSDGSAIVGPALEEFDIDNSTTLTGHLTYPAATLDPSKAALTVRVHYSDPPVPVTNWAYVNAQTIQLTPAGTAFKQGTLYEFAYQATNPLVTGIGFAATRDFISFLRHAEFDDAGNANPLTRHETRKVIAFGISQSARYLRDFLWLGFNRDEWGRQVFEGIENYIGGANGVFLNYRFAQPTRTERQHIARWYGEGHFPFANQVMYDPISHRYDGRMLRCEESHTCPKILEINSANEYWAKAASLLHTDDLGNDLRDPHNVRFYQIAGLQHGSAASFPTYGICQQPQNTVVANTSLKALLVALNEWISDSRKAPESRVPRSSTGTLVPSLPQSVQGFPDIPGVNYNGVMTNRILFDFGPLLYQGILTILPPVATTGTYASLVPKADADGNDIAGIRLPEIAAPIATYTGWALRADQPGPLATADGCDASGQQIPFATTKAERLSAGDPRLSLEERYTDHQGYVNAVTAAAEKLHHERLMLREDVNNYINAAQASSVLE